MPQSSYAYAVGRIRVLETKLLGSDKIDRMLDAPSAGDILKILAENEYGQEQEIETPHDYELLLSAELRKTYQLIETIIPNDEIIRLYPLQYDIHNLKVLLKSRLLGNMQDKYLVGIGTIPVEYLKNAAASGDYSLLPDFLAAVLQEIDNIMSQRIDPQKIDILLDRAYYDRVFTVCSRKGNTFIKQLFIKRVDLINIKTLLRVKKIGEGFEFLNNLLLPHGSLEAGFFEKAIDGTLEELIHSVRNTEYGKVVTGGVQDFIKSGSLMVYERLMDNYILDYLKSHKYNPLGIEAIVGYLLAKENELKLVRMIMVGKINNIPNDRIRERLRDVYV